MLFGKRMTPMIRASDVQFVDSDVNFIAVRRVLVLHLLMSLQR